MGQLWGREVPKTVGMFPPFHTDCGKNTVVGKQVFINMGCKFVKYNDRIKLIIFIDVLVLLRTTK